MTGVDRSENPQRPANMDLRLWWRIYRYAAAYPRTVLGLAFFAVTTAASEVGFPLITRRIVDEVAQEGAQAHLAPWIAAHLALTVLLALSVLFFIRLAGKIRAHVNHDIRADGFANLQRLSFAFYDRRPVGWLMARMTSDCDRLSNILAWGTLDLVWGVTMMAGISVAMLVLNWKLALVVMAIVPLLALLSLYFQRRILVTARLVRSTNSRITASFNEGISGVTTAKAFVREAAHQREFDGLTGEMFGHATRNARLSALYQPLVLTLASLATGLALAVGGVQVAGEALSLGTLIGFLAYTRSFFEPVQEMAAWFAELQMAQASAERVLGLIETEPEVLDSPEVLARIEAAGDRERQPGSAEDGLADRIGTIRFEGVGFSYVEGQPILSDFDLEVADGETLALVGPTGGGKSTITSLLCRFYEPTAGRITFDDVDYRRRGLHWLRSNLGIVLQTPHLFRGSVAENVRYGRLEASPQEVEDAARLVGLHELVERRPEGFETQVGEAGTHLSGGERQLVSFARAVLARPKLFVLDEATSSVDSETEQRIQRGLTRVMQGRTCFVIAHRLSTIRGADRILVIDGGRIVEQGTHSQLLALEGRYHELYTRQSLDEAARVAACASPVPQ